MSIPVGEAYWAFYNQKKAEERAAREAAEQVEQEPIQILEPGRELDASEPVTGTIGVMRKRLSEQGWTVRVFRSVARMPAVPYLSDGENHSRGDERYPAHDLETWILFAQKSAGGHSVAVRASWERKVGGSFTFTGATTYDPLAGREWRSTQLKPRKQTEIEKKEDLPPPIGLSQWLEMFAPRTATKKKKEAA